MCVCVCVHVCVRARVRARVDVRETDKSRWVYVYVRVGVCEAVILCVSWASVGGQDGNIDSICALHIAY